VARLLLFLLIGVFAGSVAAADEKVSAQATLSALPIAGAAQVGVVNPRLVHRKDDPAASRPLAFSFLYVTNAALQGFDGYSTLKGLESGATERNAMMKSVVGSPAGFIVLKASTATLSIVVAERLRKRDHRVAAFLLMLGANGFMTYVAINNARALAER
jgi:hypothetical protein